MDNQIKNILFDFGGVIVTLDPQEAVRRFEQLGLKDAAAHLDVYTQQGIFGDLESGRITDEEFRKELSAMVGRNLTWQECQHAWLGYRKEVPQRNLDMLLRLRREGYRVILVSNTNPFMMEWALSDRFDGHGHSLRHYMDAIYMSYKCGCMKPDELFFRKVMTGEGILPADTLFLDDGSRNVAAASELGISTLLVGNGEDWTGQLDDYLKHHECL